MSTPASPHKPVNILLVDDQPGKLLSYEAMLDEVLAKLTPVNHPLAVGLASFNGIHYRNPAYVQAGTIMTMLIPIALFLIFQRFFTRGIVITGVEK